MTHDIVKIESEALTLLSLVQSEADLSALKAKFLGKQGELTLCLRELRELAPDDRARRGKEVNLVKQRLENAFASKQSELWIQTEVQQLSRDQVDITLPGRGRTSGQLHPLSYITQKIVNVFNGLGFSVVEGPDIETDYYNFEALNFPADHPARDMQDTLFVGGDQTEGVLRTHTSPVQVRFMEQNPPPVRIIVPGRVYRHDFDSTHSPVFHQIEGLCVGSDVTFGHLKGTLQAFVQAMFGDRAVTRFRPSFFPFTEPSAEVDVMGPHGWLEILGCGMVDPQVYHFVGKRWQERGEVNPYDPEKISGFAFGLGIERIAMLLLGIDDIRLFYQNDIRFLEQFQR